MPKFAFYYVFLTLGLLLFTNVVHCEENAYDIKYDNIDIDEILKSERLLTNYINCLMEEGPCTEDGRELKETLPDAVATNCSKCSEKQKAGSDKIMHFIIDNRPEEWEKLEAKYDQSGSYKLKYLNSKKESD
ncbi:ejaculatory bulb-specific protein 3-like [Chironomus tepperi]|uniref:ejaculatory bulb-specific protein 3-like n=1 Tax=Chironomus tepperi TaxID=113505 RepID=UPI00391F2A7B